MYKVGDLIYLSGAYYIISATDYNKFILVCISDDEYGGVGLRLNDPVEVKDLYNITKDEFRTVIDLDEDMFFYKVKSFTLKITEGE